MQRHVENDNETLVSDNTQPPMAVRVSAASCSVTVSTCLKLISIEELMSDEDHQHAVTHEQSGSWSSVRSRSGKRTGGGMFTGSPSTSKLSYAGFGSSIFGLPRQRSESDGGGVVRNVGSRIAVVMRRTFARPEAADAALDTPPRVTQFTLLLRTRNDSPL